MKTALLILSLLLGYMSPAFACGFCAGDKAASVYSFKNRQFARRQGARYVSAELVSRSANREGFESAVRALQRMDGVYGGTVRAAFTQKAVSFVIKPSHGFKDLARELASKEPGWALKLVEDIQ